MPLESEQLQHLQAATGYAELGMWLDAYAELEKIDPFCRAAPGVLAVRLEIYRGMKGWELMREVARRLHEFQPDEVQWLISDALFSTAVWRGPSSSSLSTQPARRAMMRRAARFRLVMHAKLVIVRYTMPPRSRSRKGIVLDRPRKK